MIMKSVFCASVLLLLAMTPAQAQVIEIDSSGSAQTFDGPTLFSGAEAEPIRKARSVARANPDPSAMLASAGRDHGLQQGLLEAVAWQESRGRMSAVSVKGALGVMQLMPGTAAELGVRIDDVADNIRGGALYLRRQLDRFGGSIPLALAAYNAGPGAVIRYGGIPPYRETQNYVAKIMGRWRPPASNIPSKSATPPVTANSFMIEVPQL